MMPWATHRSAARVTSLLCVALLIPGDLTLLAQDAAAPPAADAPARLPAEQLDSLIAPIALYPDPLLAQVLAASTYPLELVQLQQWLASHKDMKDKALADAVEKQNWDPSVQSMAGLPDVVKQLAENIKWTSELGNAFLAQQSDVMAAIQRMRAKAKDSGKLTSGEQLKVETKVVDSQNVIVIEQANPEVIYVPSYNPTVVWGAPVYAYPPVYYPPVGYYAAGMALSFGVGVAMGAIWGGGWGYNCGWGGGGNNTININNNNNFNRNSVRAGNGNQINGGNRVNAGNGNWQHNPQHRGGAPYGDRATAQQYGGAARGDSMGNRQAAARQDLAQRDGGQRNGSASRSTPNDARLRQPSTGAIGGDNRGSANRANGSGDRVGNRQVASASNSRGSSAFGGGGGGYNSAAARSSSSRGASSMGGGRSRGGGGGGRRR